MKRMAKAAMIALATVVLVAGAAPMAQESEPTGWYFGYGKRGCTGGVRMYVDNIGTIHREAAAGLLLSYRVDGTNQCFDVSQAGL